MRIRELRVSYHPVPGTQGVRPRIDTPRKAAALLRPLLEHEACEVFMVALLDTKLHLIAVHTVSRGSLDTSVLHPREVFKAALLANASGIVTAHNHPSGDPSPSPEDLAVYARLQKASEILGIDVQDDLIIGHDGRYWSRTMGGIV